jgi:hypothetical protein
MTDDPNKPKRDSEQPSEQAKPEVDPLDPGRFRVDPAGANPAGAQKVLVRIPVGKPGRDVFFRTHPELRYTAAILEMKAERETYLVTPEVASYLPGNAAIKTLVLYITRAGDLGLWPVAVPGGSKSNWVDTAIAADELAQKKWVRMVANMGLGGYDIYKASAIDHEPVWPDLTLAEINRLSFGSGNVIDDLDHPVILGLLGKA